MAGYTIFQLPRVTAVSQVSGGDVLPMGLSSQQTAYGMPLSILLQWFQQNFADPTFTVETAAPTLTGFTATIETTTTNVWLIISPTGTMASGTVVFPPADDAFDGMTVLVTTTQQITALTVSSVGATFVGSPTTMGAGASVMWRYNTASLKWYAVSNTGGATATFDDIQISGDILDVNGNVIIRLSPDYVPPVPPEDVVFLQVENGASGTASLRATSSTGSGGLNIDADGALVVGSSNFDTTIQGDEVNIDSADNTVINAASAHVVSLNVAGSSKVTVDAAFVEFTVPPTKPVFTVATLPVVGTVPVGACAIVTDADTPVLGDVVTGGGAVRVGVNSDGTNWRVG